jgi:hypothetical protein
MKELRDFMASPRNSLSREAILMHRLIYDVQIAAAARGYFLEIYHGEVDQAGFDVVLNDQDQMKKLQVKTVMAHSRTSFWSIHKSILRPSYQLIERIDFEPSPEGAGSQGGVVLMEFACHGPSIDVDYYYTDVFILKAFDVGIISRSQPLRKAAVKKVYNQLQRGTSHEKIKIRKSAFLKAKSPHHLLALAGFHSNCNTMWPQSLLGFLASREKYRKPHCAEELRGLICDNDIIYFTYHKKPSQESKELRRNDD